MKLKIFKKNPLFTNGRTVLGIFGLTATVVISSTLSCTTSEIQTVTNFKTLTMQDEFDIDGAPNSAIWTYDTGRGQNGWGNNELQHYTNRSENVTVQNGHLLITAKKEDFEGAAYTSARILTKGLFEQTYGRYEARIRLPWGQGIWPAFWLLGDQTNASVWPHIGEIDIMEHKGQEPTRINGSVHGPGYSGAEAITKPFKLKYDRFDTGFHIFGIEWGIDYINFYVDDVLYNQITPDDLTGEWVFNHPFYIIMNVAVGGNYVGAPNSETVFPQTMLVDYVRVYSAHEIIN